MRYRKLPVEIDAVVWPGGLFLEAPLWIVEAISLPAGDLGSAVRYGDTVRIHTLEGVMIAQPGDYIIRGIAGELYPCKPEIFEASYESAAKSTAPLPVSDYKPQPQEAIDAVNDFKDIEERILRLVDQVRNSVELKVDGRWLAIGLTHVEQGFMALNRSIFKPGRAVLPGDETPEEHAEKVRRRDEIAEAAAK